MPVCNRKKCFVIIDDKKPKDHLYLKSDLGKSIQIQTLEKEATILLKKCQDLSRHQNFPKYGFDQNSDK